MWVLCKNLGIFSTKLFLLACCEHFESKQWFSCDFLKKKSTFLVKFHIKNRFCRSYPFQKCILWHMLMQKSKVTMVTKFRVDTLMEKLFFQKGVVNFEILHKTHLLFKNLMVAANITNMEICEVCNFWDIQILKRSIWSQVHALKNGKLPIICIVWGLFGAYFWGYISY